jgi:hypothetical protein
MAQVSLHFSVMMTLINPSNQTREATRVEKPANPDRSRYEGNLEYSRGMSHDSILRLESAEKNCVWSISKGAPKDGSEKTSRLTRLLYLRTIFKVGWIRRTSKAWSWGNSSVLTAMIKTNCSILLSRKNISSLLESTDSAKTV